MGRPWVADEFESLSSCAEYGNALRASLLMMCLLIDPLGRQGESP
jgi:hypothetical protein